MATPTELAAGKRYEQPDLFSAASGGDDAQTGSGERGSHGVADERSEQAVQQALLDIKRKFGKNSVIKAMDMFDGATGQQRNNQDSAVMPHDWLLECDLSVLDEIAAERYWKIGSE